MIKNRQCVCVRACVRACVCVWDKSFFILISVVFGKKLSSPGLEKKLNDEATF